MKRLDAYLQAASVSGLLLMAALSVQAQSPSLASSKQAERIVAVRDVQLRDSTVSGVIVNTSPRLLRDVKVMIRHTWQWKNERHPGNDNPGRAEQVTVPGEVPPSGSLPFTFQLKAPLPQRTDGHFITSAEITGFTEVGN
jgi:hypothetical protein